MTIGLLKKVEKALSRGSTPEPVGYDAEKEVTVPDIPMMPENVPDSVKADCEKLQQRAFETAEDISERLWKFENDRAQLEQITERYQLPYIRVLHDEDAQQRLNKFVGMISTEEQYREDQYESIRRLRAAKKLKAGNESPQRQVMLQSDELYLLRETLLSIQKENEHKWLRDSFKKIAVERVPFLTGEHDFPLTPEKFFQKIEELEECDEHRLLLLQIKIKGLALDIFDNFKTAYPDCSYWDVKERLLYYLTPPEYISSATEKLRSLRRNAGESLLAYAMRIEKTANQLRPYLGLTDEGLQGHMVSLFQKCLPESVVMTIDTYNPYCSFEAYWSSAIEICNKYSSLKLRPDDIQKEKQPKRFDTVNRSLPPTRSGTEMPPKNESFLDRNEYSINEGSGLSREASSFKDQNNQSNFNRPSILKNRNWQNFQANDNKGAEESGASRHYGHQSDKPNTTDRPQSNGAPWGNAGRKHVHFAPSPRYISPEKSPRSAPYRVPTCDHCFRIGHNRDHCWNLNPHLQPHRRQFGGGTGRNMPDSVNMSKCTMESYVRNDSPVDFCQDQGHTPGT